MYYGRSFRSSRGAKTPSIPVIKKIDALPLPDLLKLRRSLDAYLVKYRQYRQEFVRIEQIKERADEERKKLEELCKNYKIKNIDNLSKRQDEISSALREYEIGFLAGLLSPPSIEFQRYFDYETDYSDVAFECRPGSLLKLKRSAYVESAIASYGKLVAEKMQKLPEYNRLKAKLRELERERWAQKYPSAPKSEARLKVGGATALVELRSLDSDELNRLIDGHYSEIEKNKQALKDLRAQAAQNAEATRKLAQAEKRKIHRQLSVLKVCPYCGKKLSENDTHLDHIYPVSKGGQSRPKNLVFVCSLCNQKKRDHTLRVFIKANGLDEAQVHERLELLSKDF